MRSLITVQLLVEAEDTEHADSIAYNAAVHLMETFNDNDSLKSIFNTTSAKVDNAEQSDDLPQFERGDA